MSPRRDHPAETLPTEQQRRARILPLADRARRIAAMLDRWEAEDVGDEPDWDVAEVGRIALHPPSS